MGTVIAYGGGSIKTRETESVDRALLAAAGKERPNLLFLPTASHDSKGYIKTARDYFVSLGCSFSALRLCTGSLPDAEIERRVLAADVVYAGGGDTAHLLRRWRGRGMGELLLRAFRNGTVLSGLSAGAVCWFSGGYSESALAPLSFSRLDGLGFIPAVLCPHYGEPGREGFDAVMKTEPLPGVALGNGAALRKDGDTCRLLKSSPSARAFLFFRENGVPVRKELRENLPFSLPAPAE